METRHVRIDYEAALTGKKELLNTEISLLQIVKRVKSYRLLRKKELTIKNNLRLELGKLHKSMSKLEKDLPKENIKEDKRKNKPKNSDVDSRNLDEELMDIKRKLARLGKK